MKINVNYQQQSCDIEQLGHTIYTDCMIGIVWLSNLAAQLPL